ncbi:hypothetical protein Tco_0255850 [Tanacetum coccineum]
MNTMTTSLRISCKDSFIQVHNTAKEHSVRPKGITEIHSGHGNVYEKTVLKYPALSLELMIGSAPRKLSSMMNSTSRMGENSWKSSGNKRLEIRKQMARSE